MTKRTVQAVPACDRRWQAESDARTLAEARVIISDKKRVTEAAKAAARISIEKQKEAVAMKSVAKKGKKK